MLYVETDTVGDADIGVASDVCSDSVGPPENELALVRADTILARARGWLGKRTVAPTQALWLKPCSGVHTFGMRFSLGVFFIDKRGVVVKTIAQLKPNRIAVCWQAASVVETVAFSNQRTAAMTRLVMLALVQSQSPQIPTHNSDKNCSTKQHRRQC